MKVRALKKFEGIRDIERDVFPKEGETWETSEERANFLLSHGVIEIVKEDKKNVIVDTKEESENIIPLDKEKCEETAEELLKHVNTSKKKKNKNVDKR